MAEKTVNVKIADMEPFRRFIADIAEAHKHFYALTVNEVKAMPVGAVRGITALQSALRKLGLEEGAPTRSVPAETHDRRP